jgi:hypothetical protein
MRRALLLALLAVLPAYGAETTPATSQPITHITVPIAEPTNPEAYAPATSDYLPEITAMDIGPVQRHFALATQADKLATDPNAPVVDINPHEPMAIDKRITVPLVHEVQDDTTFRGGQNDSILYEIKYLNWGAVTGAQVISRQGHYFTVTFVNKGPAADFTARFEYRQVKTKAVVRSLSQFKTHVHGATRAYFGVVNKAYFFQGPVSAWRFTVLRGATVVAEAKSFLW